MCVTTTTTTRTVSSPAADESSGGGEAFEVIAGCMFGGALVLGMVFLNAHFWLLFVAFMAFAAIAPKPMRRFWIRTIAWLWRRRSAEVRAAAAGCQCHLQVGHQHQVAVGQGATLQVDPAALLQALGGSPTMQPPMLEPLRVTSRTD